MFAVALVLSAGVWITSSTVQTGVPSFPAAPTTCTIDAQGADDEAGQKDLSEFCRDDVNQDYVSWNLDNTQWSGQNTGDACALYDTNDLDSFANYAVCVQLTGGAVDEASMVVGSPLIYQCGNDRVDRCTNAVLLASGTTASTICEVNNGGTLPNKEDADPFAGPAHQTNDCAGPGCHTDDAITVCDIDVTDFGLTGGTTVTLLDVCSYPSGQPNSDPSDCIVTADVDPCAGVDCSSFNTDCSIASCEPTTGQCTVFTPKAAGTACGSASDSVCDNPDTCNASGVCQPNNEPAATVVCRADAGACDVAELCDGAGSCPTDTLEPVGTACGSPTDDVCDNPDTCNASGVCQPNNEPAATVVCRADAGACDVAELCDGAGSCPTDTLEPVGTACGSPTDDVCDNPDTCNASGVCQPNNEPAATVVCRADAGACDVAELCDGAGSCPTDTLEPVGTACGSPTDDVCDNPDTCNASGVCQPNNEPAATVVCRADAGACDVAEFCDGAGSCPTDTLEPVGTACGSPTDTVCDNPDTCNASGVCQPNNEPAATVVCRADAGACDVAELCDGAGSCPTDTLEPVGTACGSPTDGVCDNPDTCNASGTCQPNNEPITTVCRAADGECDVAESCDGAGSCPTDSVKAGGDLCRADTGECDVPEYCDGTSKTCPIDGFEPPDTECGDDTDDTCTNPDSCDGSGQCLPNNEPCGFVTNSSLCTFDVDPNLTGRQFRVIYSPSMPAWPAYRLHGTNPGQYYYNAFVSGTAGQPKNVKLKIPWPFVTQGAQPVHVYDGDDVDVNDCIRVDGQLPIAGESYPATITLNDIVHGATKGGTNNAGHTFSVDCSASKNAPNGLPNGLEGYECIVSVDVLIPPSGLAYVNIHLDYGVKGPKTNVNPWDEFADLYDAGPIGTNCGSYLDALQNNGEQDGLLALATCTNYVFAHEECIAAPGDPTCSDSVQNVNEFKKPKGAFGLANKSSDGSALGGLAVALVNAKGQVVSSGFTDEDGFFGLPYKHVGKAADFSLVLGYGSPPASTIVTLKANGFTEASYDATTKSWFLDSLPTKSK